MEPGPFVPFIPFMLMMSAWFAGLGYLLAKEKGRNTRNWVILGIVPVVNVFAVSYFVGAANLRLERKIDALLQRGSSEHG